MNPKNLSISLSISLKPLSSFSTMISVSMWPIRFVWWVIHRLIWNLTLFFPILKAPSSGQTWPLSWSIFQSQKGDPKTNSIDQNLSIFFSSLMLFQWIWIYCQSVLIMLALGFIHLYWWVMTLFHPSSGLFLKFKGFKLREPLWKQNSALWALFIFKTWSIITFTSWNFYFYFYHKWNPLAGISSKSFGLHTKMPNVKIILNGGQRVTYARHNGYFSLYPSAIVYCPWTSKFHLIFQKKK